MKKEKALELLKLYRVQIGSFSSKANAENYLAQAKAAGFNGFIVEANV